MKEEESYKSEKNGCILWPQLLFYILQIFVDNKLLEGKLEAGRKARLDAICTLKSIISLLQPIFADTNDETQTLQLLTGRIRKIINTPNPLSPKLKHTIYEFTMTGDNSVVTFSINTAFLGKLPELAFNLSHRKGIYTLSPGVIQQDTKKIQRIARLLKIMEGELKNLVQSQE